MTRVALGLIILTGCGFHIGGVAPSDDTADDAAIDGAFNDGAHDAPIDVAIDAAIDAAPVAPCATATGLVLCLSFDTPTFGATMANEGTAAVSANLANVTRTTRGDGGAALTLGQWHHIAQVCDNGMLTGYVDGAVMGSGTGCAVGAGDTSGLQIGANNTGTTGDQQMTGALDDVRGWSTPFTAAEICAHAGRSSC